MTAYLLGGSLGLIGILGGAALAFWWKAKLEKAKGLLAVLIIKLAKEEHEHDLTLKEAMAHAKEFENENKSNKEIIARYKERLSTLRARELDTASFSHLVDMANGLSVGVSDAKDTGAGGEVANESGDDEVTVP